MATSSDIVRKLRRWASVPIGGVLPKDLGDDLNWRPALDSLLNEAANRIEELARHSSLPLEKHEGGDEESESRIG